MASIFFSLKILEICSFIKVHVKAFYKVCHFSFFIEKMSLIRHPNDIFGLCLHRVGYPGTRHFSASGTRFQNFGKVEALVKSLKIGVALFVVTISTYTPFLYADLFSDGDVSGYAHFLFYCNNFANFFVYFWIDDKFRDWTLRRE